MQDQRRLSISPHQAAALPIVRVANAPCSWGIMGGFELEPAPTWKQVLDEIAGSGYAGTELGDWGFMPQDPAVLTPELERRVWLAHFKDMDRDVAAGARQKQWPYGVAVHEGLFCELGQGCIDFRGVQSALLSLGYEGWIVVEDELPPGSGVPMESARRDRQFLRGLGL